jgi:hypothetical protein
MIRLRQQGQREAKRLWRQVEPDALDATFPLGQIELTVSTLQREAARLSSAYLSSFIASELGEPERPPALSVWDKAFGGGDLREGLRSAVIKTKQAIGEGDDPREATNRNRIVLVNDVGLFIDTAARESLRQGMEMDDRIVGYQRALKGTCGACAGNVAVETSVELPSIPLRIHPNCQCVTEPVMRARAADKTKREGNLGSWEKAYNDAVKGIDRVHIYPKDTAVSRVSVNPRLRTAQANFDPFKREIQLSAKANPDAKTLLHELGHKLDEAMASNRMSYASMEARKGGTPAMKAFVSACRKSDAYKRIGEARALVGQAPYWRQANEMFARAYAQWVGKRGRIPNGTNWSKMERDAGTQWEAEDFKPIAKALEDLFREQGLLK